MSKEIIIPILSLAFLFFFIHSYPELFEKYGGLLENKSLEPAASDSGEANTFGLTPDEKVEIINSINHLKDKVLDKLETESDPKLFLEEVLTQINWDKNLASKAYSYSKACPSTRDTSFDKGILVSKSFEDSLSLSKMINSWENDLMKFEKARINMRVGSEIPDKFLSIYNKQKIGCAKTRCFIDKVSENFLVCMWNSSNEN